VLGGEKKTESSGQGKVPGYVRRKRGDRLGGADGGREMGLVGEEKRACSQKECVAVDDQVPPV